MWASVFSEKLKKRLEESTILKKTFIRIFTLSFAIGLLFSTISYNFIDYLFVEFKNDIFLIFSIIVIISIFIGCLCSFLVFGNMLAHIKRIIHELSKDSPRWEYLEREYMESDIQNSYLSIKKLHQVVSTQSRLVGLAEIAARVFHDIRSPLGVMEMTLTSIAKDISASQHMILSEAIQSVRHITNNIMEYYHYPDKSINKNHDDHKNIKRPILLSSLIESIISQKHQEWKHNPANLSVTIEPSANVKWIEVVTDDVKRILSNLLNNAYEALDTNKQIHLTLIALDSQLQLKISDSGHGIAQDKINEVLNGTSSKHPGRGLGLSSANDYMKKLHGQLKFSSVVNQGTEVTLIFPTTLKPVWSPEAITLPKEMPIIILDDDASIHNLWRHRLFNKQTLHFSCSDEILKWYEKNIDSRDLAIYLLDYDLRGDHYNGLQILQHFNAKKRGYLITSHADKFSIQKSCEQLDVWLIPKHLVGEIALKSL